MVTCLTKQVVWREMVFIKVKIDNGSIQLRLISQWTNMGDPRDLGAQQGTHAWRNIATLRPDKEFEAFQV